MSTTYNPSIPTPSHAPSADVGTMQTNAGSIGNWCGQYDHYGLGAANTGLHKQITFATTNVPDPMIPIVDPASILFTQNDANSHPQVRFLNSQNSGQYTIGSSDNSPGSIPLFGGIILKWGLLFNVQTSGTPYLFASGSSAFPNNLFSLTLTEVKASAEGITFNGQSKTGFTAYSGSNGRTVFYIAIGN